MMKKIIYITTLLMTVLTTLISCKKFLEKEPIGKIGKQALFEDINGAVAAVNGSYNLMLAYYKSEFGMYADVASDNLIRSTRASVMLPEFNFQSSPDDDALAVGNIWSNIYQALNNVNNVLNALPDLKAKFPDQAKKLDSLAAQGLVMRALCHFDLSRVYAQSFNFSPDGSHLGIPVLLKTPDPDQNVPRKSMKETYDQMIADISQALPVLEKYNNPVAQSAISYRAAQALLSRIYLYKGDWTQSVNYADQVIGDNVYKLASAEAYKTVFIGYPSNGASTKIENLFVLTNENLKFSSSSIYSVFSDASAAQYNASAKLLALFDAGDIRKAMFTLPSSGDNKGKPLTKKYADSLVNALVPLTIKVIRLSEVYLNRAEAKWNLGRYTEAAEDLRIISQRAHPGKTISITYTSNTDLYKQIAEERNRELCFEGHRLFDIVRRKENLQRGADCNASTCSLSYPNNRFVLPLPTKELDANKGIIQNPGYN